MNQGLEIPGGTAYLGAFPDNWLHSPDCTAPPRLARRLRRNLGCTMGILKHGPGCASAGGVGVTPPAQAVGQPLPNASDGRQCRVERLRFPWPRVTPLYFLEAGRLARR